MGWPGLEWSWWTTDRIEALAAAIGTSIVVVSAVLTVVSAIRTLRRARLEAAAAGRPMVAVELRHIPYTESGLALVLRNYGPSMARNVRVIFDPPLPEVDDPAKHGSFGDILRRRYAKPIPTLTPGMELANVYFFGMPDDHGVYRNVEELPDEFVVKVTYMNDNGDRYQDDYPLDVELFKLRNYLVSASSPDAMLGVAMESLQGLARDIKDIHRMLASEQRAGTEEDAHSARGTWLETQVIGRLKRRSS